MLAPMRASRLVTLLLLLQTRGRLTAAELARELEVSERTVHRDVASRSTRNAAPMAACSWWMATAPV